MRVRRRRLVDYYEGANPEQREAIAHDDGPALVLAGAGSGKTRVIVQRVRRLAGQGLALPSEILAVTFSRGAANVMNTRLADLGVRRIRVGTHHSLSWELLRVERSPFAEWDVDTRDRLRLLAKQVIGHQGMKWRGADLTVVMGYVGLCKANLIDPGTEASLEFARQIHRSEPIPAKTPELLAQAYIELTNAQQHRRLLAFDDMLVESHRLLAEDPGVLKRWSGRWRYIIEDEVQDSSRVQRAIGDLLGREHRNFMVVGDAAQMIYGFRGSTQENLASFVREYSPKVIELGRNYRSGSEIVTSANTLARHIPMSVQMTSERTESASVSVVRYPDPDTEGEAVAQGALELHEDGTAWGDMAVLYRVNSQSRGVEEACISARIPYVVLGGSNFYERREVQSLLAYLRVAAGDATFADVRRSLGAPFRFLSKSFLERFEADSAGCRAASDWVLLARHFSDEPRVAPLQRVAVLEWAALIESLAVSTARQKQYASADPGPHSVAVEPVATEDVRGCFPAGLLEHVIRRTKFQEYLTRDEGAETVENNRVANIRELVRSAGRFKTTVDFLEYVQRVVAASKKKQRGDRITLMSIHRSKGLEFDAVFLVGANDGVIPHVKSMDMGEERRLFYVGLTRARDILRLSYVERGATGAGVTSMEPSRFIGGSGLVLAQQ